VEFKNIIRKLSLIVESEKGSRANEKDIASELGMTPSGFSKAKSNNSIPYEALALFCGKRKININWVLFDQDAEATVEPTDKLIRLKYLKDVRGSCGGGANNEFCEEECFILNSDISQTVGITHKNADNIDVIKAVGDSMEPLISDGAVLFIDRTKTDISRSGIFAIKTGAGLHIKRVVKNTKGNLELISENSVYPKEVVKSSECEIIGKIIGLVQRVG
jgi:phage repressor protein C with HTH and peptisase S24 domain